jgi:hypothetical protein
MFDTLTTIRDALPVSLQLGLLLALPTYALAELLDECLRRAAVKGRWYGWALVRAAPVLFGVALAAVPGVVEWLREDVLGLEPLGLRVRTLVGYGVTAGLAAQVAHAWRVGAMLRGLLSRAVGKPAEPAEPERP